MNKVALTLESENTQAEDLEAILEALRPILALTTSAKVHVTVIEED